MLSFQIHNGNGCSWNRRTEYGREPENVPRLPYAVQQCDRTVFRVVRECVHFEERRGKGGTVHQQLSRQIPEGISYIRLSRTWLGHCPIISAFLFILIGRLVLDDATSIHALPGTSNGSKFLILYYVYKYYIYGLSIAVHIEAFSNPDYHYYQVPPIPSRNINAARDARVVYGKTWGSRGTFLWWYSSAALWHKFSKNSQ